MSNEKRKKLPAFTSPKGTFRFPKLAEPDYGNDKYKKPDGEYSVQLIFPADSAEAKELIRKLTPLAEEAKAEASQKFKDLSPKARNELKKKNVEGPVANSFFSEVYDKDTEEPTGEIVFKFSMKASGEYKKGPKKGKRWDRTPVVFDAKGNRMTKVPDIWGGTVGKVAFEVSNYFVDGTAAFGIKLHMTGVQVIDLVKGGERSASELGFTEEDGYEHDDSSVPEGEFGDESGDDTDVSAGNF